MQAFLARQRRARLVRKIRRMRGQKLPQVANVTVFLICLLILMYLGIAVFAVFGDIEARIRFFVWAAIVGSGALAAGIALGVLFGLPTVRSITLLGQNGAGGDAIAGNRSSSLGYSESTSLEQIADWLTKIIIGLTLTQYAHWERRFSLLACDITAALLNMGRTVQCGSQMAQAIPGGFMLVAFGTLGFLMSYLWMRAHFITEMEAAKTNAVARATQDEINKANVLLKQRESELNLKDQKLKDTEANLYTKDVVLAQKIVEIEEKESALGKTKAELDRTTQELEEKRQQLQQKDDAIAARDAQLVEKQAALNAAELNRQEEAARANRLELEIAAKRKQGLAQEKQSAGPEVVQQMVEQGAALVPTNARDIAEQIAARAKSPQYPDDPWRGVFGGKSQDNGLLLNASIKESENSSDWFDIHLEVVQAPDRVEPIKAVQFYLHPTFGNEPRTVSFGQDGRAPLDLLGYGAFTVGVLAEDRTLLELNLASVAGDKTKFLSR